MPDDARGPEESDEGDDLVSLESVIASLAHLLHISIEEATQLVAEQDEDDEPPEDTRPKLH